MRSLIGVFALMYCCVLSAELSEIEVRISTFAKASKEEAIALLEEVVNVNSGTMNHEGVAQVGEIFAREFESLGFTTVWHDMSEVDRAGHLFAENFGGGTCQLLIGHLDTVFEADSD
ncbi:MAG: M20 family peptidase, partial [Pseudomonadales bacterium]